MVQETQDQLQGQDKILLLPRSTRDFDFFYKGLDDGKLLVQKCDDCGTIRNPPTPMCPHCLSLKWKAIECEGSGTLHSFTVHHHPPLPSFEVPHGIVLVDMREGFRLLGSLRQGDIPKIKIGMLLKAEIIRRGDVAIFQFRAASPIETGDGRQQ